MNELDIPLDEELLNEGLAHTEEYPGSENITVALITKEAFYQAKKTSADYLTQATTVSHKNGTLRLKLSHGYKTYKDRLSETYNTYFDCVGEISPLHAYLVEVTCQECEEYSYLLIDKSTGREMQDFDAVPYLSAKKDRIITVKNRTENSGSSGVALNSHAEFASVTFYSGGKDTIQRMAVKEFPQWSRVYSQPGFWGNDGWYYLPVLPAFANWEISNISTEKREGTDFNYRYIRIRLEEKGQD